MSLALTTLVLLSAATLPAHAQVADPCPDGLTYVDGLPDLSFDPVVFVQTGVNFDVNPNPPSTTKVFKLTVKNSMKRVPPTFCVFEGGDAANVMVRHTLPTGGQLLWASSTDGFGCQSTSGVVTCSGARILRGGTASLLLSVSVPGVTYPKSTAIVDPLNSIRERQETNNSIAVWWDCC
jgi:hypothetical protein